MVAMLAHLIPGERVAWWLFNVHSAQFSHTGQKAPPQEAQLGTGQHGYGLVRTSGEQASICKTTLGASTKVLQRGRQQAVSKQNRALVMLPDSWQRWALLQDATPVSVLAPLTHTSRQG